MYTTAISRRSTIETISRVGTTKTSPNLPLVSTHSFMKALISPSNSNKRFIYTIGGTSIKDENGNKIYRLENAIINDNLPNIALSGSIYTKVSEDGKTLAIKFSPNLNETLIKLKRQTENTISKILDNPRKFITDNKEILTLISGEIISLSKKFLNNKEGVELANFIKNNPSTLLSMLLSKNFIVPAAVALSPAVINFIKAFRPITLAEINI